jgi:hypothetical protein
MSDPRGMTRAEFARRLSEIVAVATKYSYSATDKAKLNPNELVSKTDIEVAFLDLRFLTDALARDAGLPAGEEG